MHIVKLSDFGDIRELVAAWSKTNQGLMSLRPVWDKFDALGRVNLHEISLNNKDILKTLSRIKI